MTTCMEEVVRPYGEAKAVLMTEGETADYLSLSCRTLQAWRVRGCGPKFVKVGRSVRYQVSDVQEFLKGNVRHSTSGKSPVLGACLLTN